MRSDYDEFDEWIIKCTKEHRPCWIIKDGLILVGIIIRKDENYDEAGTKNFGNKILKVCTFKIASTHRGEKLGEQLLKQVLWFAQKNKYDLVYLTAFSKQAALIRLLEEYGFTQTGKNKRGELVLEKLIENGTVRVREKESALEAARRNYPRFVDGDSIKKFIVPIRPLYHAKLFPEVANLPKGSAPEATGKPGNTIRKVYICHAPTAQLLPGSLLIFYMTKSNTYASQSLTSIGVIESVRITNDLKELRRWTAKQSVFSDSELNSWVRRNNPLKVIDFLLIGHLGPHISLEYIVNNNILKSFPQSITKLFSRSYEELKPNINLGFEF